jgi:hypothetical protein
MEEILQAEKKRDEKLNLKRQISKDVLKKRKRKGLPQVSSSSKDSGSESVQVLSVQSSGRKKPRSGQQR